MNTIHVTPLARDALHELIAALDAAGLPTTDVLDDGRLFFRFDDTSTLGFAGIEGVGADRLLRSVVVLPSRRHAGAGVALVGALEHLARSHGVDRLHLLTTTARPFFERCGFTIADRASAPPAIAASREFRNLCPSSAAYLVKSIGGPDAVA